MLPRSNFRELEKVPSMILHFQHHKRVFDKDLSFAGFLVLHFSPGSEHDEPAHETELPLHNGVVTSFLFTLPELTPTSGVMEEFAVKHFKPFCINYQFQYSPSAFQPPRQAC